MDRLTDDDEVHEWLTLSEVAEPLVKSLDDDSASELVTSYLDDIARVVAKLVTEGVVEQENDASPFETRFKLRHLYSSEHEEEPEEAAEQASSVASATWTGIQPSTTQREELAACLSDALHRIEALNLAQEQKAQARALIIAVQVLSDAPEPPFDIIRLLAQNFDRLLGVSGWLVGAISLILEIS
jgi:hypothetical protein